MNIGEIKIIIVIMKRLAVAKMIVMKHLVKIIGQFCVILINK